MRYTDPTGHKNCAWSDLACHGENVGDAVAGVVRDFTTSAHKTAQDYQRDWEQRHLQFWNVTKKTWDGTNAAMEWEQRNQQFWYDLQNPDNNARHNWVDVLALVVAVAIAAACTAGTAGACAPVAVMMLAAGGAQAVRGYGHAKVDGASDQEALDIGIRDAVVTMVLIGLAYGATYLPIGGQRVASIFYDYLENQKLAGLVMTVFMDSRDAEDRYNRSRRSDGTNDPVNAE